MISRGTGFETRRGPSVTRYAYKASLIGSAHRFELTDEGLSWQIAGRSGVWRYDDISAVRLVVPAGVDAVAPLSRRYRKQGRRPHPHPVDQLADRGADDAAGHGYRAFISELHARMAEAGSKADADRRPRPKTYAAALAFLALLAVAMAGLSGARAADRRIRRRLFLVGFAALFAWQIGGFIRRNRPRS